MDSMIEEVEFALDRVTLVASTGEHTGGVLRWVIWDRNRDTDDELGWVYIGPEFDIEKDTLENPPGALFWKLKHYKARAAIAAMREPTEAMIAAGVEARCEHGESQCGAAYSWQEMIGAALTEGDEP